MPLQGLAEMNRRLDSLSGAFEPMARRWAEETVSEAQRTVHVKSGRTRASIHISRVSRTGAVVVADGGARFQQTGTKEHFIRAKRRKALAFPGSSRTIFAKKVFHRATRSSPFLRNAAQAALDGLGSLREITTLWYSGG